MLYRSAVVSILLLFLIVPAAIGQEVPIDVPYTHYRLKNGLNVLLHRDPSIPFVSVNVWYHVGSGNERPGRTGFAHLFEHIMYEGSKNAPEGKYDEWLESAGASNNGSTTSDRTNYYVDAPSGALELTLFLESDRMGYLLDAMSEASVDGQRDVVKNERRQSYENRPYGLADLTLSENLFPQGHPYHWPVIGYMDDLSAAGYQDIVDFFTSYYGPNNASLAIAGDIDIEETRALVDKWFAEIPAGPPVLPIAAPPAVLTDEKRLVLEDRVQLPRLYMVWISPALFHPGDAELDVLADVLASGKNSRLYKRLVVDLEMAQDVRVYQDSEKLAGVFRIEITARPGYSLSQVEAVLQEELDRMKEEGPEPSEVARVVNQIEAGFLDRLQRSGGFSGKANSLNSYFFHTGNPGYFEEDLARYKALRADDVRAAARAHLGNEARVVLSVVPQGKPELASVAAEGGAK